MPGGFQLRAGFSGGFAQGGEFTQRIEQEDGSVIEIEPFLDQVDQAVQGHFYIHGAGSGFTGDFRGSQQLLSALLGNLLHLHQIGDLVRHAQQPRFFFGTFGQRNPAGDHPVHFPFRANPGFFVIRDRLLPGEQLLYGFGFALLTVRPVHKVVFGSDELDRGGFAQEVAQRFTQTLEDVAAVFHRNLVRQHVEQ